MRKLGFLVAVFCFVLSASLSLPTKQAAAGWYGWAGACQPVDPGVGGVCGSLGAACDSWVTGFGGSLVGISPI